MHIFRIAESLASHRAQFSAEGLENAGLEGAGSRGIYPPKNLRKFRGLQARIHAIRSKCSTAVRAGCY